MTNKDPSAFTIKSINKLSIKGTNSNVRSLIELRQTLVKHPADGD